MRPLRSIICAIAAIAIASASTRSNAQYYQLASQLSNMATTAILGGFNYKGYVEASGLAGVGSQRANFVDITTTQGVKYADWFYMGLGTGVEFMLTNADDNVNRPSYGNGWPGYDPSRGDTKTGVIIPLYTDFRFFLGGSSSASCFIDLRLGCSFLVNSDYIRVGDGYLTSSENFYLRPSVGVRIPVNPAKPNQAINVALTYQLMTSNYWSWYGRANNSATLNAIGLTIAYEW